MGSKLKYLLCLILLVLGSSNSYAQVSEIHQGILTVPVIRAGEVAYRAEFSSVPNSNPVRFELIASSSVEATLSSQPAIFSEGVLTISAVQFNGESYWLELSDSGNNIFTVSAWGLNSPPVPTIDHGAPFSLPNWQRLNGSAYDIGVGANGDVWVIGTNYEPGGYGIYNLSGAGGFSVPGGALRIDVDPQGNPWIINDEDKIYRWIDGFWQRLPGRALDIGIGADGSVWVTSYEGVYRWDGLNWINFGGSGGRIDVGPNGQPWVVGFSDRIYTLINGFWQELPGFAGDIGVGANGAVWVVAPAEFSFDGFEEPRRIYRWNGFDWSRVYGDAIDISVGPDGMPWVTNYFADIYRGF